MAYVLVGRALVPADRGAHRAPEAADLVVTVLLSLVAGAALWAYARRGRGAVWNALGLALVNLVVFAAGTGLALLVFVAALRLLPPA